VGTSGFSYATWIPRFYAPGKASRKLLAAYAARLPAVELNNTFYRRPNEQQVQKWMRETGPDFRFCPKAQRGTAWRAWQDDDPSESFAWLTDSYAGFGSRLGPVLLSALGSRERNDEALERVLGAWPDPMRLALDLPHPSWADAAVRERVVTAGAAIVASDWDDREPPSLSGTGAFLYLRLRRSAYTEAELDRWAERIEAELAGGRDAFIFLRHDEGGQMALHAEALWQRLRPERPEPQPVDRSADPTA